MADQLQYVANLKTPPGNMGRAYSQVGGLSATPLIIDFRSVMGSQIDGLEFCPSGVYIDNQLGTADIVIDFLDIVYRIVCPRGVLLNLPYPAGLYSRASITGGDNTNLVFVDLPVSPFIGGKVYVPGNIVGPVSQVGGVPTGAIIESGTNANGSWTKWADGTMICDNQSTANLGINIAAFGNPNMFRSELIIGPIYPQTFAATPRITFNNVANSNFLSWPALFESSPPTTKWPNFYLVGVAASGTPIAQTLNFTAKGRWF